MPKSTPLAMVPVAVAAVVVLVGAETMVAASTGKSKSGKWKSAQLCELQLEVSLLFINIHISERDPLWQGHRKKKEKGNDNRKNMFPAISLSRSDEKERSDLKERN